MLIQLIAKTNSIEVEPVPVSIDRTLRIHSLPDWILRGMVNSGRKGQNMCKLATVIGLLIAWRGLGGVEGGMDIFKMVVLRCVCIYEVPNLLHLFSY